MATDPKRVKEIFLGAVEQADETGRRALAIHSRAASTDDAPWTRHATGALKSDPSGTRATSVDAALEIG